MFSKKTVRDIDLKHKTVLVRVDYNVPVNPDGTAGDLYRVKASLPTIEYLLKQKAKIVLISHLGRPEGKIDKKFSLQPVAAKLSEMLGVPIQFAEDCVGEAAKTAVKSLKPGDIVMLENLRFHKEEEANDPKFAKELAALAEVFVQDGFGVVHRAHASTEAITKLLPSVAGLLLEKEVSIITEVMQKPQAPFVAIVGGAKVSDKIEVIDEFIAKADHLVIGGAMANTFLAALGHEIGQSIYEREMVNKAKELIETAGTKLELPLQDVAVGKSIKPAEVRREVTLRQVAKDDLILDFGARSLEQLLNLVKNAKTIIWNGPIGMNEMYNFGKGTLELARAIGKAKGTRIAGGGDTAAFLEANDSLGNFDLVSTGGGASLELMAGKELPGVAALPNK